MNTNERKPVLVIYDDENLLQVLQQELCNAMFAAAKGGLLTARIGVDDVAIYEDESKTLDIMIHDQFCSVHSRTFFDFDDDIEQLRIKAQIAHKERELLALKNKLNN